MYLPVTDGCSNLHRSHLVNSFCDLDPMVKFKGQIMYFLVTASPPKPLDVASLNFAHDVEGTTGQHFMFVCFVCLILYVPSTIFHLYRDESSWVEPVLR